ncbi:MAG: hypothetical protein ACK44E_08485 [Anaerolineales bacterium]
MAFTVREYRDLLQLLNEHPEWREELRRTLLSDDFLALPQIVRELAEAQKRTEQRVEELVETQRKSEERLTHLEQTVAELIEAQKRNAQQIRELIEIVQRHEERLAAVEKRLEKVEERLDKLTQRVDRVEIRLAKVDERTLELEHERKAGGYFGRIIRNPQVVNLGAWEKKISPPLEQEEFTDVWLADLILRGQLRQTSKGWPGREAWLVIEVSVLIDAEDIEGAIRRATLLRKADLLTLPIVAGENITERALQMAEAQKVIVVTDGSMRFLEQALQHHT